MGGICRPAHLYILFEGRSDLYGSKGAPTDYAITAEDFVFAFQRMFLPGTNSPYAVEFSALENSAAVLAGQKPASALGVTAAER